MSMETTCPGCRTTFRVTTEQLNAHQGDVRCGVCKFLFNAFDSLAPARETAAVPDAMHAPEPQPIAIEHEPVAVEPEPVAVEPEPIATAAAAVLEDTMQAEEEAEISLDFDEALASGGEPAFDLPPVTFAPEVEPAPVEEEEISFDLGETLDALVAPKPPPEPAPSAKAETERVPAEVQAIQDIYADFVDVGEMPPASHALEAPSEKTGSHADIDADIDADLDGEDIVYRPAVEAWDAAGAPRKPRFGWLFGIGALPLLFLLAGQSLYYYRVELASQMPAARPYLERACGWIACTVPIPHNADLLKIESSDLEADTEHPTRVTLATTVSNRANYRQMYPLLELTLTNHADEAVARRVFTPSEYLPVGSNIQGGMAAGSESSVRLSLDLGDLNAVGYRLYVFYAAQR